MLVFVMVMMLMFLMFVMMNLASAIMIVTRHNDYFLYSR